MYTIIQKFGDIFNIYFLLFIKDALIWSKVIVKTFNFLQKLRFK